MRIIHKDIRKGEVKVQAETLDDLWSLSRIIDAEDRVSGYSLRKIKMGDESDRKSGAVRKRVFITLNVEKVEFHEHTNILRVSGTVMGGSDEIPNGSHHTLNVEEGTAIKIIKESWPKFQLERLNDAVRSAKYNILICVHDREEAYFAHLKRKGYSMLSHFRGDVQKKGVDEHEKPRFYQDIIKKLEDYDAKLKSFRIIIASPAFFKEDLMKCVANDNLKKKIILATCSSLGENGIVEVLKRTEIKKVMKEERTLKEINLVEELFTEISKNGLASYGIKETENAIAMGAVKTLLITDEFIRSFKEKKEYRKIDSIIKNAESIRADVHIISSEHDGGRKLDGLGGIGAILRYKTEY